MNDIDDRIKALLSDLQLMVFDTIRLSGFDGLTCEEVEDKTKLRHQTASARIKELSQAPLNLVEPRGIRRPTRSGRTALVWIMAGLMDAKARSISAEKRK